MIENTNDQKIILKVGEIKAFTEVALKFLKKCDKTLSEVYGEVFVKNLQKEFSYLSREIVTFQKNSPESEAITQKSKKTEEKVTKMQEMYIKEEWDNVTELTEWLGFFAGSAIVHWTLVMGRAQKSKNVKLVSLCQEGKKINEAFFQKIITVSKTL